MGLTPSQWVRMSVKTNLYRDFFTEEELGRILGIVDLTIAGGVSGKLYEPVVVEKMSRQQIEVLYPEDIKEKLEGFASQLCGEPVIMSHNSYLDYDAHYAGESPSLPPHRDFDNYYSLVTFDYLISKTVDWAIVIEGQKYYLNVGDMLVFDGAGLVHWRENIMLNAGDSVKLLTMHFSRQKDYDELYHFAKSDEQRKARRLKELEDDKLQGYRVQWKEERERIANGK